MVLSSTTIIFRGIPVLCVCDSYLLEPSPLLLLLLNAFLAVMEELTLVLFGVTALCCKLGLLPLQRL